jgi:hypothetical protein
MKAKIQNYTPMNLNQNGLQPEFELSYYSEQEPDIRRDPNRVFQLFIMLVVLFAMALAVLFITKGQIPFFE